MGNIIDRLVEGIENYVDKISLNSGFNLSLYKRGLYDLPGKLHFDFRGPGFNIIKRDLNNVSIKTLYERACEFIYTSGTLEHYNLGAKLSINSFSQLRKIARKNSSLVEKLCGHESVIAYSISDFYQDGPLPVSFFINSAFSLDKAKPFMVKLVLLEQNLLQLREYIHNNQGNMTAGAFANKIAKSAILYEYQKTLNEQISSNKNKLTKFYSNGLKSSDYVVKCKTLEQEINRLIKHSKKIDSVLQGVSSEEIYYGNLAVYFLISDHKSESSKNIEKWVDTHIEFETYRTLFAAGVALEVKGRRKRAKKLIDLAIQYSTFSRPNCAFLERIYYSRFAVYSEILAGAKNSQNGHIFLEKGSERKEPQNLAKRIGGYFGILKNNSRNNVSEADIEHDLLISGIPSKNISYEEFREIYEESLIDFVDTSNEDLDTIVIKTQRKGDIIKERRFQFGEPKDTDFDNIPRSNVELVGSKTNTFSLYGPSFINALFGATLGFLRFIPGGEYIALADNELPALLFSVRTGVKKVFNYSIKKYSGRLYDFSETDVLAEKLAYAKIEEDMHFLSHSALKNESAKYGIDSLLELNNAADFLKGLGLTVGAYCILKEGFKIDKIGFIPEQFTEFVLLFCASWASFSGLFDKPVNGVLNGLIGRKKNILEPTIHNKKI